MKTEEEVRKRLTEVKKWLEGKNERIEMASALMHDDGSACTRSRSDATRYLLQRAAMLEQLGVTNADDPALWSGEIAKLGALDIWPAEATDKRNAQNQHLGAFVRSLRDDCQRLSNEIERDEALLHQLEFENRTLRYSKASVDLTNINIKVAIWVPVVILVVTLFATIGFETFRPEVSSLLRHLVGLTGTGN